MPNIHQITSYVKYLLNAKDEHSIHAPFIFNLYTEVICDENPFYVFEQLEGIRSILLKSNKTLNIEDWGAGKGGSYKRKVSSIASSSLKNAKYAQLLFRLVNHFKPQQIIELGTSLGITTMYLAYPSKDSSVTTFEGSNEIASIAELNFKQLNLNHISLIRGNMDNTLTTLLKKINRVDFAFIDGNHSYAATINYFNNILNHTHPNSILVLDDIYWSKEMTKAWEEIKKNPKVSSTIDLYQLGIVFLNNDLTKQHFKLRF